MSTSKETSTGKDFYIGYLDKAPDSFLKRIRLFVIGLAVVVPLVAAIIVANQNTFSTGTFELGKPTQLTGVISAKPVPSIKVVNGRDLFGNPVYQTIPLINFGKFGAAGLLRIFEKEIGGPINRVESTIEGTLIYRDGKTLFELTKREEALISTNPNLGNYDSRVLESRVEKLGRSELSGEIVDPKCYFGVMKPGEGKPHRSCAALCIKGGIPPVFVTTNENGEHGYFLLLGKNGEMINEDVLDFVAIRSKISGELARYDDWMIIYADPETEIEAI